MLNISFIVLQASNDSSMSLLIEFLVGLLISLVIFLVIRSIVLWYWKIDVIVKNQEEQIRLLSQSLEQENRREARINYYKYRMLGDKRQAYESLIYIVYYDLTGPEIKDEARKDKYEKLKSQYIDKFEALGYEFPSYPF